MKKLIIYLVACLVLYAFSPSKTDKLISNFEPIAVVELFTSQGCSSCPPADKLLSKTKVNTTGKRIFLLSFHVDYWNRLGWKDPFSNKKYSQRQTDYATGLNLQGPYTPQMIINGKAEFVGSDEIALQKNVEQSLSVKATVAFLKLTTEKNDAGITISYKLDGGYKDNTINLALVADKETTAIKAGENDGLTMVNENIVKYFATENIGETGEGTIKIQVSNSPQVNWRLVAFVQNKKTNYIVGAASQNIQE